MTRAVRDLPVLLYSRRGEQARLNPHRPDRCCCEGRIAKEKFPFRGQSKPALRESVMAGRARRRFSVHATAGGRGSEALNEVRGRSVTQAGSRELRDFTHMR